MSYANAPIVLNSRDATNPPIDKSGVIMSPYNNLQFNAVGQNIIQGDIKEIAVSEVNFPYDIPNVQAGYNTFELVQYTPDSSGGPLSLGDPSVLTIVVPPSFYTGDELATEINTLIDAAAAEASLAAGTYPTLTYTQSLNRFVFVAPTDVPPGNPTPQWAIFSPFTFPYNYAGTVNALGKDLLSIMGFYKAQAGIPSSLTLNNVSIDASGNKTNFASGSAPLIFTQYIDICSTQLCGKQRFPGGSTTNLARRGDVICRLYIDNNISIIQNDVEGTRPFTINRQYFNARVMRWTTDNSIATIDIQLYDDCGQPLTTTWQPRPYQITFNCYEKSSDRNEDREDAGSGRVGGYGSYQEANVSKAWHNLSRQ